MQHRSSRSARNDSIHSSGRPPAPADGKPNPLSRTLFAIFGGYKPAPKKTFDEEGAKKVDPKIYFSLERTFLAWMKAAIWIAGISIAIGSRSSNSDAQALYSLFFLGVAIAFIIYALVQCKCDIRLKEQCFPLLPRAKLALTVHLFLVSVLL